MVLAFLLLIACSQPPGQGVYRSGPNAILKGHVSGEVLLWGPSGTVRRLASEGPKGTTLLGQSGPLWRVDHELPPPPDAPPVAASLVEAAGFRFQDLLGTTSTGAKDAALAGGVQIRSMVKHRRTHAPPLYLVTADANCQALVAVMDSKASTILHHQPLPQAGCAPAVLLPPIDLDGDGRQDVLVYGQKDAAGFRQWFGIETDGALTPGPGESWTEIPE